MPLQLLQLAEKEGIVVEYWELKEPLEAVYWSKSEIPPVIGLSKALYKNKAHFRTVLAEELGHYFTSARNFLSQSLFHYKNRLYLSREEYVALKWAARWLIPEDKLYIAFRKGIYEPWALANYFNVDEDLVKFRLNLLSNQRAGICRI